MKSTEITAFKFGALTFRVQGLGVFFPSDELKARVAALPLHVVKAANTAAWKQRRTATRDCQRYSQPSYGLDVYDRAHLAEDVATKICSLTWTIYRSNTGNTAS